MSTMADVPVSPVASFLLEECELATNAGWTEAVSTGPVSLLNYLRRQFKMSGDVCAFLRDRVDLLWALLDAQGEVERAFGRGVAVRLELVHDPEVAIAAPRVCGYIAANAPLADAIAALRSFDQAWTLQRRESEELAFDLAY